MNNTANTARDEILSRLSTSISKNTHIPNHAPHFEGAIKIEGELLETFKTNHSNNKGIIVESSKENLPATIAEILRENEAKEVLYNVDIDVDSSALSASVGASANLVPYTKSVDEIRSQLFSIDTSIVQARCGVADLGILCLSANKDAPRLSSLITNTCIYLLPKENIVQHIFAGIEFAKGYERKRSGDSNYLPTNIIFVAGPSRTADIELITVFGVHGPRKTYVVLY
ncbi:lactate utilization protein C [Helicobacter sp. MIT 99-10781]|uniref:LutC/YkgG family protein n=1 Tax=Helicobacter sp. MIT 99-10781 TaxID=1332285 RepID=UPI000E20A348|nr:lactate utilization protein C [Helicobacter sp. MIT 99-10781]RDU56405.1 lactate utilization protein C [Helicobacter sp. MIT 99-10781]